MWGYVIQLVGVKKDSFFWPEHVFLKGCFSFKTEDLMLAWFLTDYIYHVSLEENYH